MMYLTVMVMFGGFLSSAVERHKPNGCQLCVCVDNNTAVDCSNRNLTSIPVLPKSIKIADFSGNILPNLNRTMISVNMYVQGITNISFRNCQIKNITKDTFRSFSNLQILDLSENDLSWKTVKKALYGLSNSTLRMLNISSLNARHGEQDIVQIPYDFFQNLNTTPLTNLSIRNNDLETISGSTFEPLAQLQHLDLSTNSIRILHMTRLPKLKFLNLTMNEFKDFPDLCGKQNGSLVPLVPRLKYLHLSINSISDTVKVKQYGRCLPNLQLLNLSYNPIRIVLGNSFSDIPQLKVLSLMNLFSFEVVFQEAAFNATNLEILHIGNSLRKTPVSLNSSNMFKYCPNLKELDLTLFKLTYFTENDFRSMIHHTPNLTKLVLDSTSLHTVPPVGILPNLEVLILRKNYIKKVESHSFANNTKLKRLSLSLNQISVLTKDSFPPSLLDNIIEIDLAYNPFSCICDLEWFIHWVEENKRKLQSFPAYYVCDAPENMRNVSILRYDPDSSKFCHPINQYVIMSIVLGIVLVLIIAAVIVIRKYRWDIKYYIYLMRSKKGYERIPESDGFSCDAFVSYNANDRAWVMSQILENLERRLQYKLCLHERDFIPGEIIVDQIAHNIKTSRKVILVISNNFAKSQWCQFEIMLAQNRFLTDGKDILIPILLEDIKPKYISASLKALLNSLTFLEWTNNVSGQELFINKLELAMKI